MKYFTIMIISMTIFSSCKNDGSLDPASLVRIFVDYESGFVGDSLIISLDGKVLLRSRGSSDNSNNFSLGCLFETYRGVHRLSMVLPIENARGDTSFVASGDRVVMDAHFDRSSKIITYQIFYTSTQ